MNRFRQFVMLTCASVICSCAASAPASNRRDPVVGVWLVQHPTAPFPWHLYVFNSDGTMQQANPDAGDPRTSDSDGKGAWVRRKGHVIGKWVELFADRTTHKYAGRGELSFDLVVTGDRITGQGKFFPFGTDGKVASEPIDAPFTGDRVKVP